MTQASTGGEVIRHEEKLDIDKVDERVGSVNVNKHVDTKQVRELHHRSVEEADIERAQVPDGDSGEIETLPDGSISVPVFEERLIVTKERFVRERVIVRKRTTTHEHVVEAAVAREHVEVEEEGDVHVDDLSAG